jgi:hypothetical protein
MQTSDRKITMPQRTILLLMLALSGTALAGAGATLPSATPAGVVAAA